MAYITYTQHNKAQQAHICDLIFSATSQCGQRVLQPAQLLAVCCSLLLWLHHSACLIFLSSSSSQHVRIRPHSVAYSLHALLLPHLPSHHLYFELSSLIIQIGSSNWAQMLASLLPSIHLQKPVAGRGFRKDSEMFIIDRAGTFRKMYHQRISSLYQA